MISGVGARELYQDLLEYEGTEAYADVVTPWLHRAGADYRAGLVPAAACSGWWARPHDDDTPPLVQELYALSRVSELLLLGRQPHNADVAEADTANLTLADPEYLSLFTALGMTPSDSHGPFDPFLHEIVDVEQADDPDAPIEVTEALWPGLMLGDLLFSRAGVRVRAGAASAGRGVADRSPLYWGFRRRHRPTVDLSQGWGGNSQWRTALRLDYRTTAGDRLNVAGDRPIDGDPDLPRNHPGNLSPEERLLTSHERRDLLRHRTLLRPPQAAAALAESGAWEREFQVFDWRLPPGEE
ncbi:hypothetical protein [Yinghuangia seranimata]|uniref:hypothetical protein n=1 Tax=Yinghuangia seranimata TaxID=408067 RepID=UPI00248C696D|nr:hypothetical protein [Yinghuangia seranimata]MDI2125357.1 hypothetical protein [Yinghuangia seranimata]